MAKLRNPGAFKHWIDDRLVARIGSSIKSIYPGFDSIGFVRLAPRLKPLELKPRVRLIRDALRERLPDDYEPAVRILLDSAETGELKGFDLWPYTEFIQEYGLEHVDFSLGALYRLTQKFTSEFAVRPFLRLDPFGTLARLEKWAEDPSVHVRRWVSEGTRPRLPWGERLNEFIRDPKPTLNLLEKLKYDDELYVRKSIANHLNDISKDHPRTVVKVLDRWQTEAPAAHLEKIRWIRNHALRTLIKKGHPGALKLIGVKVGAKVKVRTLALDKTSYKVGETLKFRFKIASTARKPQKLVIDYVIHHVKVNRRTSPKVFKLKTMMLAPGKTVEISKQHSLKLITTRTYHPGRHLLEIQVNGKVLAGRAWALRL